MKNLLIIAFFCIPLSIFSQEAKQPKIRYTSDFFGNRFEIGDKDAKTDLVLSHLEKNSPQGYFLVRKAVNQEKIGTGFGIVSLSSVLAYFLVKEPIAKGVCALTFSTTAIVALSLDLSSKSKYRKGVDIYNKKFGY